MLSHEDAMRLGLLLLPRSQHDWFDVISMVHSFLVVFIGFLILLVEAALYLEIGRWVTFLSSSPSKPITLLFTTSIVYYTYDILAMAKQYIINTKTNADAITSSKTYYYGFVLHHFLCILGLGVPLYNKMTYIYDNECGPLILLCFMLGELPNIPRLAHKIIARRFECNAHNVHNNTLHTIYFVFKGCFIWCRLGVIQLTWNVLQPIAPLNVLMTAWALNVFGVIAVCWEWRMMQFKNYQTPTVESNATNSTNHNPFKQN
eukprot:206970_1